MPIQPIPLTKFNTLNYQFGSDFLTEQPELGALVAFVIGGWSIIQTYLGTTFGILIGARQPAAMSMYAEFRSFEVQRTLLVTAARDLLPMRYADIVEVTLIVLGRANKTRHEFAHHLWGASLDIPNALLLAEPKGFWQAGVREIKYQRSLPPALRGRMLDASGRVDKKFVRVYPKNCLEYHALKVNECFDLSAILNRMIEEKMPRRRQFYQTLCKLHDVRATLTTHMKAQKRTYRLPVLS
jgi:hypothetical protein